MAAGETMTPRHIGAHRFPGHDRVARPRSSCRSPGAVRFDRLPNQMRCARNFVT